MRVVLCLVVVLVGPVGTRAQEDGFLACVRLTGAEYRQARDAWLANPDRTLLERKLEDPDWLQRAQAAILLGWLAHGPYYQELVGGTPRRDQSGQPHYSWYRAERLRPEAVPLLHELILKGGAHGNAELDAAAALATVGGDGTASDPAMFLSLLGDQRIKSVAARRSAAIILSRSGRRSEKLDLDRFVVLLVSEQDEAMRRLLLDALAAVASVRPGPEKDRLVTRLASDERITRLVTAETMIRAIARIGGTESAGKVTSFLEKTPDAMQQRWAVNALSRMPETPAMETVIRYARTPAVHADTRLGAVRALANCPYSEEVNDTLAAIARNADQSLAERREAIKTLDQVHLRRVDQGGDESHVRQHILRLQQDGLGHEVLDADLKQVAQRVLARGPH